MIDLKPADPIEGILISQLVAANQASLSMYQRAWALSSESGARYRLGTAGAGNANAKARAKQNVSCSRFAIRAADFICAKDRCELCKVASETETISTVLAPRR